jgi:hypothetical protein
LTTTPFVTLTNCDLNMYTHISYKPLQDSDYRGKKVVIFVCFNVMIYIEFELLNY